ncbi:MAG: ADP-glyceromanno-heptose 6-epimerase [Rhodospirillales bacterium]|nr:ADP-glyceromanno-heptose 6-epimerase [Rhodospirillales bacterium]
MIVVTGGAGFIGSNLVAALEDRGTHDIAVCDRLGTDGKWRNLAKRAPADIVTPDRLFDFLDRRSAEVETIVHLGASSSTTETDVDFILDNNFRLSSALWDWCADREKRLIYASSAATYGDGAAGFDDDASPATLARLRPLNPYGWSKHLFDRLVAKRLAGEATRPAQHVGLKFFNVYGPNEYHKGGQRSVVDQIYPVAAAGQAFPLFKSHNPNYPDGGQMRDFIWVGDCVAVMLWLLDNPKINGLFNLGTGKARSFLDLANAVYRALGRNANITFRDTPVEIRDKYQYFTEARMERLRAAGYAAPFTPLEDGVRRYVQDFLAAADPYR